MAELGKDIFEKFVKRGGGKGAGLGVGVLAIGAASAYAVYNSIYTGIFLYLICFIVFYS